MLALAILFLPCLIGLAFGGHLDPLSQGHVMAPGRVLDTLISRADSLRSWTYFMVRYQSQPPSSTSLYIYDAQIAAGDAGDMIEVGNSEPKTLTYKSCRGKISSTFPEGWLGLVELNKALPQAEEYLFNKGNIDDGLWEAFRIDGSVCDFEFVKDAVTRQPSAAWTTASNPVNCTF
ncbi:hypothetical protein QBC36DRAFT_312288 [Triangularia setosa]|uniref:Uncharacterized protein n=1 Tax=Triangularia setosa TaxID=2587417 RepID=A0AAN6W4D5_9PEZI|nr:hypothetical protein QBC36DRAFT_312288 [Podospora setosa]